MGRCLHRDIGGNPKKVQAAANERAFSNVVNVKLYAEDVAEVVFQNRQGANQADLRETLSGLEYTRSFAKMRSRFASS
eukprot:SAG22_NODE_98_length_20720_cov_17.226662_3_plen_78_part_00